MTEPISEGDRPRPVIPANPRVAILGCSLASGLGVREKSVGRIAANQLGASKVLFKAKARQLIDDSVELLPRVLEFEPDLVVISTGNAEALVHPTRFVEQLLTRYGPKSWQGEVGLDARPYYSEDRSKQWRERITSVIKVIFKNVMIRLGGGYTRMSLADYVPHLERLLDTLTANGCAVVVVGTGDPHPLLFPGSRKSLARFDEAQQRIVAARPGVALVRTSVIIDLRTEVQADKAHPNVKGHEHLARAVVEALDVQQVRAVAEAGSVADAS
jgi:lysophospholipase L1-like esterase